MRLVKGVSIVVAMAAIAAIAVFMSRGTREDATAVAKSSVSLSSDSEVRRNSQEANNTQGGSPQKAEPVSASAPIAIGTQGGAASGGVVASKQLEIKADASDFGVPEVRGEMAIATIETDGQRRELRPNQIGEFPRVAAVVQQSIPLAISYPEGEPNQEVAVTVQDGGRIDEGQIARLLKLDTNRSIAFSFVTGQNDGIYRVSLRKGADTKTFSVWVGPELKLAP